jgi:hypothetical protein
MENKFIGTNEKWRYEKPTSKFDACTISVGIITVSKYQIG